MSNKTVGIIGAILIIISLFFPIMSYRWTIGEPYDMSRWMFGLFQITNIRGTSVSNIYWGPDIIGIACTLLLVVFSLLIIKESSQDNGTKVMKFGIYSVIVLFGYFLYTYWGQVLILGATEFVPNIGFFGILIGGILAIIGGKMSE